MDLKQLVQDLWNDMDNQNWDKLPGYFSETATINWHNTNECFSVHEFVLANSKYPGEWSIKIEKLLRTGDIVISVVRVMSKNANISFHATSFFKFKAGKIEVLDEYWGEDEKPPQWRIEPGVGQPIS
jgi:hypothetical protein